MKWIKKNICTRLLVLVLVAGICLMLYPKVSDYWNSFHQSRSIAGYAKSIAALDDGTTRQVLEAAQAYNQALAQKKVEYTLSDEEQAEYQRQLDVSELGIMGYIDIPKIHCSLPIYHGTDAAVLQIAAGHVEWTSLPVGGESSHCVISGHRGLPSAKLFSDLDRLEEGDRFTLSVLNETLTYEVDQIQVVLPEDTDALQIVPGEDLCTLVTCTPYGINSHRLLVRGHRVENDVSEVRVKITSDAVQTAPLLVASVIAVPLFLLFLLFISVSDKKSH